jgi:hypothetical protein
VRTGVTACGDHYTEPVADRQIVYFDTQGCAWWLIGNHGSYEKPRYHFSRDRSRAGRWLWTSAPAIESRIKRITGNKVLVSAVKMEG